MSLKAQQEALQTAIVAGTVLPGVSGRLSTYQHAYRARLAGALRDNFGSVPRVLGDEAFDSLAHAYLAAHPSTHASIRWFGAELPDFIAAHPELVPHAALVDLARLEWALRGAFDAADADALTIDALTRIDAAQWPALVVAPMPGLQLLSMRWNIAPIWRALQRDDDIELPEPLPLDHTVLVWRQALTPRWRTLDERAARLLREAIAGASFAELCELDADAAYAAAALRGWVDDGLLSDSLLSA